MKKNTKSTAFFMLIVAIALALLFIITYNNYSKRDNLVIEPEVTGVEEVISEDAIIDEVVVGDTTEDVEEVEVSTVEVE